jgi:hypothetical protein
MKWCRLYSEFATDPKMQTLGEVHQRRFIMLMCLQSGNGIETFPETGRDEMIAFWMRISRAEVLETKAIFLRLRFINEDWTIRNWEKRQYASDSSTERVRKYREAQKQTGTGHETKVQRFSNAPEQNRTDTEQNIKPLCSSGDERHTDRRAKSPLTQEQAIWFEEFWGAYWLRRAKKKAQEAFTKHVRTADRFAVVMAAVRRQTPEMLTREPSMRPQAATWINGERCDDEVPEPARTGGAAQFDPAAYLRAKLQ